MVNQLWADEFHYDIDNLLVGKLPSGNKFFGFVANDLTPYMITSGTQTILYLNVGGNLNPRNTFRFSGTCNQAILSMTSNDWYALDGGGGMTFPIDAASWNRIKSLITQCGGEEVPGEEFRYEP